MWRRAGVALASSVHQEHYTALTRVTSATSRIRGAILLPGEGQDSLCRAGGFQASNRGIATSATLLNRAAAVKVSKEPEIVVIAEFDKEARDGDILAGSVSCQVQKKGTGLHLYIKSLNVVPAYRRQAIGSMLLNTCLEVAQRDHKVIEAYLHVPTNDVGAITFCEKRGFTITDRIRSFYKEAENRDCYVLSRRAHPGFPFRPDNVNNDLIEPAAIIAEFEKNVRAGEEEAGSIICQVVKKVDHWHYLYIKSLEVNSAYRRKTIGSQLLKHVLEYSETKFGIVEAFLYVPTNNLQAMAFCEKCGFSIKERLRNFYRASEAPDCYLYSKRLVKQV